MNQLVDSGPSLLLEWREPGEGKRHLRAGIGSLVVHVVMIALVTVLLNLEPPKTLDERDPVRVAKYTPIYAPPFHLTQKEPSTAKAPKQVHLEDLLPKPQVAPNKPVAPVLPKKTFQAPPVNSAPPAPQQSPAPVLPEPPKIEAAVKAPQIAPPAVVDVPPPQPKEEKPKLTFETPGQSGTSPTPGMVPKVLIPKPSLEDAIRAATRNPGGMGSGIAVSDVDQLPTPPGVRRSPSQGRMQSSVQLQSDPMGVDFKPYLIRVLAMVKRNWFAVYPESARLGLRGTVALRFWVDRNGQVPHLELAGPSGATALDRAAVASISASVPLPPLPSEYKGKQIVLQFSFQYN